MDPCLIMTPLVHFLILLQGFKIIRIYHDHAMTWWTFENQKWSFDMGIESGRGKIYHDFVEGEG